MNLKNLSNIELHFKTKELAKEERKLTVEVIRHLREVNLRRVYAERGHPSLFAYCIHELGYSESSAHRRIAAMRVAQELPEIESKIQNGTLTLSNIAQAQSYFKAEQKEKAEVMGADEKREILQKLENRSTREAEKALLELRPHLQVMVPKREERRLTETYSKVEMVLTDEDLVNIQKLKSLMSHINPNMSHADLYKELVCRTLKQIDPEQKSQRKSAPAPKVEPKERNTKQLNKSQKIGQLRVMSRQSRYISAAMKQEVYFKSRGICTYKDPTTNKQCGSRHLLQVEHIHPIALGGKTEINNLTLLCRSHNLLTATQKFGLEKMSKYISMS